MEAVLTYPRSIFSNLRIRIKRFFNPLPEVGSTTTFAVDERHWDEAKVSCNLPNNARSSHCVLAQAIAERFDLNYVGVGGDGFVSAYETATDDTQLSFQVDESGVSIISAFDSGSQFRKPSVWPVYVEITRMEDR